MFKEIPHNRPDTPLLDSVNFPSDLRKLKKDELQTLAAELRHYLLYCVGKTGGHFGAGLGVVELTVALHYVFNTPQDKIVWDVGHQTYPHKILTGRREALLNVRKINGISGFPKRSESEYDTFGVGHSSTSISAALGMAVAAQQIGRKQATVAVIGDGALTGGMAFEALAHAVHTQANLIVILNDNEMSISKNVGGLSNYFAKLWASKLYINIRESSKKMLSSMPPAKGFVSRTEEYMKGMVSPGTLFEELGFNYLGPYNGHDLHGLIHILENLKDLNGPQLVHIATVKGKGFQPAEADPIAYHAINKIEPKQESTQETQALVKKLQKFQDVFGQWLCDMAEADERLIGITPAMCEGSGMVEYAQRFPKRFYDVAIAEQHAVTFAAGLACEKLKPVLAIYSTFLQRGYDQLIHDVAIQKLDVLFAIDRAGLVGEDGATHSGSFDLSYLRCIPEIVIAAPSDENECRQLLFTCYQHQGPAAVRYPRGTGAGIQIEKQMGLLTIGKGRILRQEQNIEGRRIAILAFGTCAYDALLSAEKLATENINATVVDMRFVKPLDEKLILDMLIENELIVTIEENALNGGAGSGVNEFLNKQGIEIQILNIGLPDEFVIHGSQKELRALYQLDAAGIEIQIKNKLATITK
jgi:1-deoxy-D-xylulose-5-phosphate synthase